MVFAKNFDNFVEILAAGYVALHSFSYKNV